MLIHILNAHFNLSSNFPREVILNAHKNSLKKKDSFKIKFDNQHTQKTYLKSIFPSLF